MKIWITFTIIQQLFMAVQESIKIALENQNVTYRGENTLKESAILWLQDSAHNCFMNELLKKEAPFYFVVVNHPISSLSTNDN